MKVYLFGNEDLPEDNKPFMVAKKIAGKITGLEFIKVLPNEDLPFAGTEKAVIMDTVSGIDEVEFIEGEMLDKIFSSPRTSVHDFDLGFQLKYLKKLGKLGKVMIIGLPQKGEIDYFLIQSIFKKLVAQDIQGS